VDHSYTYPGTFTVELKVTDSSGASDSETMDITVRETPGSADVTINLISPEEYTINLDGFNRTLVKPDEKANVVVDISGGADYYKWYLDGELFSEGESNDELLLNAGTFENGIHYLLVCVQKNGRLYSGRFQFTVEN